MKVAKQKYVLEFPELAVKRVKARHLVGMVAKDLGAD